MPEFQHQGRRISYEETGEGDRLLVLVHGVLVNKHMFDRLGSVMAAHGNRVVTVDLLGHGESDRPPEMVNYSMTFFAEQVIALLDHLEASEAVVGGTSLGANTALTVARMAPERVRGMMIEMPVLDSALLGVTVIFTPLLLALRFGEPVMKVTASLARRVPRTHPLVDLWLDLARSDPRPAAAVLEGLFLGPGAPHHDERVKLRQPTLVIGHRADPLHPFSDSGMLVEELPNARMIEANSILEWRISPGRLDRELAIFLEEVWAEAPAAMPAEEGLSTLR
ncbi:MAG: alpha/beta hydrolase fold protein [Solirubrobacterales bacterium]|nr:alpha/beta hydrolase fold protein [Solirubrobacterales bacterium]